MKEAFVALKEFGCDVWQRSHGKFEMLLGVFWSYPVFALAAYTRRPGQSAADAALSSIAGHFCMAVVFGGIYLVWNWFKKR